MTQKTPSLYSKSYRLQGTGYTANGAVLCFDDITLIDYTAGAVAYDPEDGDSVSGAWSQSVAAGTTYNDGRKSVSVELTFTPDSILDYEAATLNLEIPVTYTLKDRTPKIKGSIPNGEAVFRRLCGGEEVVFKKHEVEDYTGFFTVVTPDGNPNVTFTQVSPLPGEEIDEDKLVTFSITLNEADSKCWSAPSQHQAYIRVTKDVRDVCLKPVWNLDLDSTGEFETRTLKDGSTIEHHNYARNNINEDSVKFIDGSTGSQPEGSLSFSPDLDSIQDSSYTVTATFTPDPISDPVDPLNGLVDWYDAEPTQHTINVQRFIKGPDGTLEAFGCWVEKFSSSVSFGAQSSSVQLTLVEDPDAGKLFTYPTLGTAYCFKYGQFYFGGIVQRWTYDESTSGKRFDLILESPGGKILSGVNVILSDFDGGSYNYGSINSFNNFDYGNPGHPIEFGFGTPEIQYGPIFNNSQGMKNIYNALAHYENYSAGGTFGDAGTNSAGFPARLLLDTIELMSRNESVFGSKISFGESEFEIDLTAIKTVPENFRISNQVATITNIIEECCEILQYSYTYDVQDRSPPPNFSEDGSHPINRPYIILKIIERSSQPEGGRIQALITEKKNSGKLVSHSTGKELSDEVVQQLIVGAPATRYVIGDTPGMVPVWGKDVNGKWILQRANNGCPLSFPNAYDVDAPVTIQVTQDQDAFYYDATVDELRMATGGRATWQAFKVFESVAAGSYDYDPWVSDIEVTEEILQLVANRSVGTLAFSSTSLKLARLIYNENEQVFREQRVEAIWNAVQKCANNFFGRVFLAAVPEEPGGIDNNLKYKNERPIDQYASLNDQVAAWAPSASAWVEEKPVDDLNFYDDTGKMKPIAVWGANNFYDYNALGQNYGFYNYNGLFGVASSTAGYASGGEFVYWTDFRSTNGDNCALDPGNDGVPCVVVDAGAQVKEVDIWTGPRMGLVYFAHKFFGISISEDQLIGFSHQLANIEMPPRIVAPGLFGMPQVSNRYSWGPWFSFNGTNGRSQVGFDTNLAPENFGSVDAMNQMGLSYVESNLAEVTSNESGRVRVAEKPAFNISDRLAGSGPYVTSISCSVDVGGIYTDYEFNTWTPKFGKLAKFNADRLSRIYKDTVGALKFLRGRLEKAPIITYANKIFAFQKDDRHQRNRGNGTALGFTQFQRSGGSLGAAHISEAPAKSFEGAVSDLNDAFGTSYNSLANDPWAQYKKSFTCSQEQIFSPYQTAKNKEATSSDEVPKIEYVEVSSESASFSRGAAIPGSEDIDPYFPRNLYQQEDDGGQFLAKTDYHSVINEVDGAQDLTEDLQIRKVETTSISKIRSVGLRGPAVMSGWGYDLANNPVPFQASDQGSGTEEDITVFDQSSSDDRTKWETGPVKLMWDKERKVWSGGHDILVGILKTDITAPPSPYNPTTFEVEVLRKINTPKGQDALALKGETITGYNRDPSLTQSAGDNSFIMVQRINYEWVPVKGGGGGGDIILFETDGYTDVPTAQIIYVTINRLSAGQGTQAPSEDPHEYPGFPDGWEIVWKGYSYDIQSDGDAYLTYGWIYRICNDDFNALEWADSNDMVTWVENLEEQNGGNSDWYFNDHGRMSTDRDTIEDTKEAILIQPAGWDSVDLIPIDPARVDPDNCDTANNCKNLPEPTSQQSIQVTILARPCGSTSVPEESDGRVTVVDTLDAFLYGRTADDIKGRKGSAVYVQNDGEYDCYWAILWMDMFDTVTMVTDITFGTRGVNIERKKVDIWWHCDLDDEYIEGNTCEES